MILEYRKKKKIRNCDHSNRPLTYCLMKYFDKLYGHATGSFIAKYNDLAYTKFNGADKLYNKTGCLLPCETTEYYTREITAFHGGHIRDQGRHVLDLQNDTTSALLIVNHVLPVKILLVEEVPQYTVMTYIGDVGGIVGIFLGMSFWSIYEGLIGPLLDRIQAIIARI
jgi:hypothetical protein